MIKMGMGEEHCMDTEHLAQRQISGASTCINQDVAIQHQARSPQIRCNAAAASEYRQVNDVLLIYILFVSSKFRLATCPDLEKPLFLNNLDAASNPECSTTGLRLGRSN